MSYKKLEIEFMTCYRFGIHQCCPGVSRILCLVLSLFPGRLLHHLLLVSNFKSAQNFNLFGFVYFYHTNKLISLIFLCKSNSNLLRITRWALLLWCSLPGFQYCMFFYIPNEFTSLIFLHKSNLNFMWTIGWVTWCSLLEFAG